MDTPQRLATLRNMATSLFLHERIRTTAAKARALRPYAEKLITLAKEDTPQARREVFRKIQDTEAIEKLFEVIGPRFKARPGGYTRIVKVGQRIGDAAHMSIIELVERTPKAAPEPATTATTEAAAE